MTRTESSPWLRKRWPFRGEGAEGPVPAGRRDLARKATAVPRLRQRPRGPPSFNPGVRRPRPGSVSSASRSCRSCTPPQHRRSGRRRVPVARHPGRRRATCPTTNMRRKHSPTSRSPTANYGSPSRPAWGYDTLEVRTRRMSRRALRPPTRTPCTGPKPRTGSEWTAWCGCRGCATTARRMCSSATSAPTRSLKTTSHARIFASPADQIWLIDLCAPLHIDVLLAAS